jgi:hypothetical protein
MDNFRLLDAISRHGMPIGGTAIMLALVASMGGFIFGYDTGQISDILLLQDFKLRFAKCSNPTDPNTCEFSTVHAGLIVSLLSFRAQENLPVTCEHSYVQVASKKKISAVTCVQENSFACSLA